MGKESGNFAPRIFGRGTRFEIRPTATDCGQHSLPRIGLHKVWMCLGKLRETA